MKLKCMITSAIIASKGSEEKLPGWVRAHITRCGYCEAEMQTYARLQTALKAQNTKQECSLTADDMMAALRTTKQIARSASWKPALSFATAAVLVLVVTAALLLTYQSNPDRPGNSKLKPNVIVKQTPPEPQHKEVPLPEKPSIAKKEVIPAEKLVVVANNNRFSQGKRTNEQQHMPVREIKKPMPHQKHEAIDTPEPEIIEPASETETNVATIEHDPIMIVPEDQVIEVVQDDQNFDTRCSYEIQLVNTEDSGHAVPL